MNLTIEEREQFAEENIRLIHYFTKKYHNSQWNYDDLFGAASLGMTKALNSFDKDKGIKFATYSARCIINAIFMFMRTEKRHLNTVSIDQPVTTDESGNELTIMDTLSNPEAETDWRDISPAVNTVLNKLSERDGHIMRLFFENTNQREIAKQYGISQSYISRIIQKTLKKIKKEYWRGEKTVGKLKMTAEEFVDLKYKQNLSFVQIAKLKGVSDPSVHNWKDRHAAEIKKVLKELNLPAKAEKKTEPKQPEPVKVIVPKSQAIQTPQQSDTAVVKAPESKPIGTVINETLNEAVNEKFAEKTAEYERLIAALRSDLNEAHKQLDEKDEKIHNLEHLHAACEDCESEISILLQEKAELERKLQEELDVKASRLEDFKVIRKQRDELKEENQAMRLLIKKWA